MFCLNAVQNKVQSIRATTILTCLPHSHEQLLDNTSGLHQSGTQHQKIHKATPGEGTAFVNPLPNLLGSRAIDCHAVTSLSEHTYRCNMDLMGLN